MKIDEAGNLVLDPSEVDMFKLGSLYQNMKGLDGVDFRPRSIADKHRDAAVSQGFNPTLPPTAYDTNYKDKQETSKEFWDNATSGIPKSILDTAKEIIYGDREKTYGSPDKNLKLIAAYWSAHISSKYNQKIELTIDDVCVMMVLLKQARLANTPDHKDSLLDTCGYMALAERCQKIAADSKLIVDPKSPELALGQLVRRATQTE